MNFHKVLLILIYDLYLTIFTRQTRIVTNSSFTRYFSSNKYVRKRNVLHRPTGETSMTT